jgi:predicted DNA-binding transcriptional regulator
MVSKDQGIGGIIFIICALIAVLYIVLLFGAGWMEENISWFTIDASAVRYWVIAVPVFIALIAIMGIGMWIGWTMATTPPPKPIEEITSEIEEEAKEEEKPEKKTKK